MRALRRVGVLVATIVAATVLGHLLIASSGEDTLSTAISSTPRYLQDTFLHFDLGVTEGRRFNQRRDPCTPLCPAYGAATVAEMFRERVPVDVALLLGGLLVGTAAGVAGGRWCVVRPAARSTRVLHVATALQLSSPVFFQAMLVLFSFSSNASELIRLPFLSGAGDYAPPGEDPLQFLKAMWLPWILVGLPLAAFVLRITEASLREAVQEDFIRTARAKGLSERGVMNRHALPVAVPPIALVTGVNVSTMLINIAVIEYAYNIPGLFRLINTAVRAPADVPVLQALVVEGVMLVVLANALADAAQARLDPRVRRHA